MPVSALSEVELDRAGITDPTLRESYRRCRELNNQHGRTYFLATLLLPAGRRPFVHALYGFARYADEVVDDMGSSASEQDRAETLMQWGSALFDDLRRGRSQDPVRTAVVDTILRFELDPALFEAFLESMAMDLTVTHYETYADLQRYVYGSAEVIGLQMLPILQAPAIAAPHARDLGAAFQLANFIRDVGEDLDRGRIYLPLADLERFRVSPADLQRRVVTDEVRAALQYQVARVRRLERAARPGIAMIPAATRDCVETARVLYCGIVDAVADIDYQVFDRRAKVGVPRRLAVAGPAGARAWIARQRHPLPVLG